MCTRFPSKNRNIRATISIVIPVKGSWNLKYRLFSDRVVHNSSLLCARMDAACFFSSAIRRRVTRTCIYIASRLCKPEAIIQRDIRCCADRNVTRSNDQSQVHRYGSLNWSDGNTGIMEVYTYYFLNSPMKKEQSCGSLKGCIIFHCSLWILKFSWRQRKRVIGNVARSFIYSKWTIYDII